MKKRIFKIFLSIVILLALSYSYYLYNFQNIYFINWLSTLISTILSLLLALVIAIYIFYYQTNSIQEETRNKFIPLIEGHLIEISRLLYSRKINPMKVIFSDGKELYFYLHIFHSIVFEQAIYSNVFNEKQTEFLLTIKAAIYFHNEMVKLFINMYKEYDETPDKHRKSLIFLYGNHEKSRKEFKQIISSANKYFEFIKLDEEIKKKL